MIYLCCDHRRRLLLRAENERRIANGQPPLNGIDFLEVLDLDAPAGIPRQRTLLVWLLEPAPLLPGNVSPLTADNVRIEGGDRITPVNAVWAFLAAAIPAANAPQAERDFFANLPAADRLVVVRTDSTGDYSPYRLSLVQSATNPVPPANFDVKFAVVEFSFKVECPTDFDCAPQKVCPETADRPPAIDYLAKDYQSFRCLMLDRMSLLMPQWRERNAADLGVTLVELLAYVADRLSYQQDATATEAYLDTARRRVSVRRHARLVDYFMHDGCNARTWVQVQCDPNTSGVEVPKGTQLLTKVFADKPPLIPNSQMLAEALRASPVVFETMHKLVLFGEHEQMPFYTWGDERCCLPKGATRATLREHLPNLEIGNVLVLVELTNPRTGDPDDADRTRRHAVRLTQVQSAAADGTPLTDVLTGQQITEIAWDVADALPVPFCISAITDKKYGEKSVSDDSVAWGNVVLADHGVTVTNEDLGEVPKSSLVRRRPQFDRCSTASEEPIPPRFRPSLARLPVTQACPYDPALPAAQALATSPSAALPVVELQSEFQGQTAAWEPRRDLLNSSAQRPEFVVEVENNGRTSLRFGDDALGRRPDVGMRFIAKFYRTGNGVAGNIGTGALFHVVTSEPAVIGVRNPLPATGGTEPETMEQVRQRAPFAFRTQARAVTEADYARMAERNPAIQRAAATFRWTGSWHTAFVTVDPLVGVIADQKQKQQFELDVLGGLEPYRMAGHDLEADEPRYASLEIEMHVCVKPSFFRSQVKAALLEVFSDRLLPDGRRGVFHPDHFTFGQSVELSPLYAAAQAVAGVESAHITTFQRQGQPSLEGLESGRIVLDRLEIARCASDPNFPEHGVFRLDLGGGK